MRKQNFKLPYDLNGNMLSYGNDSRVYEWRDNKAFDDELVFLRFERGRSAAHALFESQRSGKVYAMFLVDLGEIIPRLTRGRVRGTFIGTKRGTNYAIRLFASVV